MDETRRLTIRTVDGAKFTETCTAADAAQLVQMVNNPKLNAITFGEPNAGFLLIRSSAIASIEITVPADSKAGEVRFPLLLTDIGKFKPADLISNSAWRY